MGHGYGEDLKCSNATEGQWGNLGRLLNIKLQARKSLYKRAHAWCYATCEFFDPRDRDSVPTRMSDSRDTCLVV